MVSSAHATAACQQAQAVAPAGSLSLSVRTDQFWLPGQKCTNVPGRSVHAATRDAQKLSVNACTSIDAELSTRALMQSALLPGISQAALSHASAPVGEADGVGKESTADRIDESDEQHERVVHAAAAARSAQRAKRYVADSGHGSGGQEGVKRSAGGAPVYRHQGLEANQVGATEAAWSAAAIDHAGGYEAAISEEAAAQGGGEGGCKHHKM